MIAQNVEAGAPSGEARSSISFFDVGSTLCLVRYRWARAAGLQSEPHHMALRVVGSDKYEQIDTRKYTVSMKNKDGCLEVFQAIGMDHLSHIAKVENVADVASR